MVQIRPDYAHLPLHRAGDDCAVSGPAIAICCDDRFAFQALVALASIFLNSPSRSLDLVIVAVDWPNGTVDGFDRLARRFGRGLSILRVSEKMLPASFTNPYLPRAAFFRLMVPDIIESERLLCLDADVITQIDLDEIWRDYRNHMMVGGVADVAARDWKRRLGVREPDLYINSGVLLVDGAVWRSERARERCADWLAANAGQAVLADQDAINNALSASIYLVPERWNVTRNNQALDWRLDPDSFRGIYHFAGRAKPWMRWAEPALQEFYLHYARVVGLPAGYWVEARLAREAIAEAFWAERQGDFARASGIHKRVAAAALAKLRQTHPDTVVELP